MTDHKYGDNEFKRALQIAKKLKLEPFSMKELSLSITNRGCIAKVQSTKDKATRNKEKVGRFLAEIVPDEVTSLACSIIVANQEGVIIQANQRIRTWQMYNPVEVNDES